MDRDYLIHSLAEGRIIVTPTLDGVDKSYLDFVTQRLLTMQKAASALITDPFESSLAARLNHFIAIMSDDGFDFLEQLLIVAQPEFVISLHNLSRTTCNLIEEKNSPEYTLWSKIRDHSKFISDIRRLEHNLDQLDFQIRENSLESYVLPFDKNRFIDDCKHYIKNANHEIIITSYIFNEQKIVDSIISAKRTGRVHSVKVVYDASNDKYMEETIQKLIQSNISIYRIDLGNKFKNMHIKTLTIDGSVMFHGSANLTRNALSLGNNHELIVRISNKEIISRFIDYQNTYFGHFREIHHHT